MIASSCLPALRPLSPTLKRTLEYPLSLSYQAELIHRMWIFAVLSCIADKVSQYRFDIVLLHLHHGPHLHSCLDSRPHRHR